MVFGRHLRKLCHASCGRGQRERITPSSGPHRSRPLYAPLVAAAPRQGGILCVGPNQGTMKDSLRTPLTTCVSINEATGETLFFCQRCGHYAQVRWQKLLGPCSRTPSIGTTAWYQRKRLLDGKHPGTRKAWGIPYSAIRFRTLPCEDTSLIASYGTNQFDTADADLRFEDSDEDPLEAYPNCWGFPPPSMAEEFPALDLFGAEYDPPQFDTAFGNLDEEDQGLQACGEDMGYLPEEGDEGLSHGHCEDWN